MSVQIRTLKFCHSCFCKSQFENCHLYSNWKHVNEATINQRDNTGLTENSFDIIMNDAAGAIALAL